MQISQTSMLFAIKHKPLIINLRRIIISLIISASLEFDGSNTSQKLGQGQQKAGKVSGTKEKQFEENVETHEINQQQVSNMIGYKESTLERQSLSEIKMDRGSAIYEKTTNCGSNCQI